MVDMYWWVDWLAYGPMLGLFFVRLGYVRTLREFVLVNMVMPSMSGFVKYMSKRPLTESGEYVYEDAVANAPDSGEESIKSTKIAVLDKISTWFKAS